MSNKKQKIKKSVIITGYQCNNNCSFCINSNKRNFRNYNTEEIMKEIVSAKKRGATYLELIGGEPTIRPDIVKLISFAHKLKFDNVVMATNGTVFYYKDFTKKIIQAGLTDLIFSIHGHDAKTHDALTKFEGSFDKMLKGIDNVKKTGLKRLGTNTTIVKQNYRNLPKIAELILNLGIKNSEFIFIDPTYGAGHDNFFELVPKISEVAPFVKECLEMGRRNKVSHWAVRYVPFCCFVGYEENISEFEESKIFDTEHLAPDFVNTDVESSRKNISRIKPEKCLNCIYYDKCEGIWKEYIKNYGDDELSPIKTV